MGARGWGSERGGCVDDMSMHPHEASSQTNTCDYRGGGRIYDVNGYRPNLPVLASSTTTRFSATPEGVWGTEGDRDQVPLLHLKPSGSSSFIGVRD